jgi:hypothetical protein
MKQEIDYESEVKKVYPDAKVRITYIGAYQVYVRYFWIFKKILGNPSFIGFEWQIAYNTIKQNNHE